MSANRPASASRPAPGKPRPDAGLASTAGDEAGVWLIEEGNKFMAIRVRSKGSWEDSSKNRDNF
jgi:hypothetical protein